MGSVFYEKAFRFYSALLLLQVSTRCYLKKGAMQNSIRTIHFQTNLKIGRKWVKALTFTFFG